MFKALNGDFSEVQMAVVCSEVFFYNDSFKKIIEIFEGKKSFWECFICSTIETLLLYVTLIFFNISDNNLFQPDPKKWKLESKTEEYAKVNAIIKKLLSKLRSLKKYKLYGIALLKIIEAQESLHQPISELFYLQQVCILLIMVCIFMIEFVFIS